MVAGKMLRWLFGRLLNAALGKSMPRGTAGGWLLLLFASLFVAGQALAAGDAGIRITTSRPGGVVSVERELDDTSVLLSVRDTDKNPMFGLGSRDFAVTSGAKTGRITAVEPESESLDVPRNIVLVLDNSDSMRQRHAVAPLLAGVDEVLKIVRPIDRVQVVVFSNDKAKALLGGRELGVRVFSATQIGELKKFVAGAYDKGLTETTVLYDAMLAGLDLIKAMPANESRFLVVFSDGEDINSVFGRQDVTNEADAAGRFHAYVIDYMPGAGKDAFLSAFAGGHQGDVWKATSEANLIPIFQNVASKMRYYYVVRYLFPPTGSLGVSPAALALDEVTNFDGSLPAQPRPAPNVVRRLDATSLTLHPQVDTMYGIANWKVRLANNSGILNEQAGEGAPPAETTVGLATYDLAKLATGGDLRVTMALTDTKGQTLTLSAPPVKLGILRTSGSLTVAPAELTIDEVVPFAAATATQPQAAAAAVKRLLDARSLTLLPKVEAANAISRWRLRLANNNGTLAEQAGEGAPPAEIAAPLAAYDPATLAAGGDLRVTMELSDAKGQTLALAASPVRVNVLKTSGSLSVAPASVTVEEVKTIDSSPMLGYVYFAEDSSELQEKYVRLAGQEETAAFDEQRFRDTMEKYYQVLNIVGKRLAAHPGATVTLVGCNANVGKEKRNKKLAAARAATVADYLRTVWKIAPERIRTEARNLPEMPSASRVEEGRAENRRVEIRSDDPSLLAPVRSIYLATRIDTPALTLRPQVSAPRGIKRWKLEVTNSKGRVAELSGNGQLPSEIRVPINTGSLAELAVGGDLAARMEVEDGRGQELALAASPVRVDFIQTSKRLAEKQEFRVQEKYALILFDFDSEALSAGNQAIVAGIVSRIKELPQATIEVVGHTDTIGKEDYNLKLSERRALAVYRQLNAAAGQEPNQRLRQRGVGPREPLFDNQSPEARAFNRTVTITLEYMQKDE